MRRALSRGPIGLNGSVAVRPCRTFLRGRVVTRKRPLRILLILRLRLWGDLSKTRKILGFYLRRRAVLAADRVVNFLAVDADLLGGVDPQTNLVAADIHHG